jgi:hypothetical protein
VNGLPSQKAGEGFPLALQAATRFAHFSALVMLRSVRRRDQARKTGSVQRIPQISRWRASFSMS